VPRIEAEFGIDPQLLLYDTTNFFTFIATSNDRSTLAQRGHSKAKRNDLRQVGLALLVSHDFQVPLLHKVYDGNIVDVSLFPRMARDLIARFTQLGGAARPATLVFDKGNVSEEGMEELLAAGIPFVAALPANRLPEFIERPMADFSPVTSMPGTRAYAAPVELYGKACLGVVAYTESFFTQQLSGVTANMVKCEKKLLDLQKSLKKWDKGKVRGKRPTAAGVRKSVAAILSPQFMKDLFHATVEEKDNLPRLRYEVDHTALQTLVEKRLGRTVLLSAHTDWSAAQTIEGYRGLAQIEEVFKNMKNTKFLHWQPAWHWTDQKLRVHALYCVLALLLATLARKTAVQHGCELSLPALLEELTHIREVAILYPPGTMAHRKDHIALSRMSPRQKKLADCLEIAQVLQTTKG
jgi:transposase